MNGNLFASLEVFQIPCDDPSTRDECRLTDRRAFILSQTCVKPVPHAEEISLHVADEAIELWHKTEEELGAIGLPPPFWAFAWAGGQALARYILDTPDLVRGKRILDFACGSALVGIAAMLAGARSAHAVDIDPFAIVAGRLNADLNGVELSFQTADITEAALPDVDLVVTGDVFYDESMAIHVLAFLERFLDCGIPVFIGDPGRSYLPIKRLHFLAAYHVPAVGALEDSEIKKSSVFRLISNAVSS